MIFQLVFYYKDAYMIKATIKIRTRLVILIIDKKTDS